jgi:hypothetical protein
MSQVTDSRNGIPVASTLDADKRARWFRAHLAEHSLAPPARSPLDRSLVALASLAAAARGEAEPAADRDFAGELRDAIGVDYMIRVLDRVPADHKPAIAKGYSASFSGADVCLMRDAAQSQERDRAWELLVAGLCANFATEVVLDEPDVRCQFQNARWGLACKVLYSPDSDRQIDRIVEGAKQIERAPCDLGIVAVNATNLICHNNFIREIPDQPGTFYGFRHPQHAIGLLRVELGALTAAVAKRKTVERLGADKAGEPRWKTRAVVFFAQTVALVGRAPVILSMVNWYMFRAVHGNELSFLYGFNDAGQTAATHTVS